MFQLPKSELKTKAKITIYHDELDDKGKQVIIKEFETLGAYYSTGDFIRDNKGELTRTNGSFYVDGDACTELFEIHHANIVIGNTTLKALSIKKARYQGKVVYTKFLIE